MSLDISIFAEVIVLCIECCLASKEVIVLCNESCLACKNIEYCRVPKNFKKMCFDCLAELRWEIKKFYFR